MNNIPYHLGIIIDGNRRWAKEKGLPSIEGHRKGFEKVRKMGDWTLKRGIKILTVYCFSSENWNRSKLEVNYLMRLFGQALNKKSIEDYNKKGVKIKIIGERDKLSSILLKKIAKAEKLTKDNKKGIINLAFSYGGRPEITKAVKNIIKKNIPVQEISEDLIEKNLWTAGQPSPDLIIRSGGHHRLSNFLTWQSAYSELYFIDKYWPAFEEADLDQALSNYYQRQRNFGK